jgi:hypothetical protein
LFERFNEELARQGFAAKGGHIVDGSFVEVPRQRNTREENEGIKAGEVPESFEAKPQVKAQKDCDARWTKKNETTYYGYKNHVKTDVKHKIVRDYEVTPASVHDSNAFLGFFPDLPDMSIPKTLFARKMFNFGGRYLRHPRTLLTTIRDQELPLANKPTDP